MYFLAFEGLDGSGKSTLMKRLETELKSRNHRICITREPGGTALGDQIRELLLSTEGEAPSPRTEILLYEASRAQHVDLVIRPALEAKTWVLCDRFTASTVAFQAGGRGLGREQVDRLNDFATGGLVPDLTVLVDLTWEQCENRQKRREGQSGQGKDRMEREAREFHDRVRQSFLEQARISVETWIVLDGLKNPQELTADLLAELGRRQWLAS